MKAVEARKERRRKSKELYLSGIRIGSEDGVKRAGTMKARDEEERAGQD